MVGTYDSYLMKPQITNPGPAQLWCLFRRGGNREVLSSEPQFGDRFFESEKASTTLRIKSQIRFSIKLHWFVYAFRSFWSWYARALVGSELDVLLQSNILYDVFTPLDLIWGNTLTSPPARPPMISPLRSSLKAAEPCTPNIPPIICGSFAAQAWF